jgi:hypothetical protein
MKTKSLTLNEIRECWWWNGEEIRREGVRRVAWPLVEEAARNYELMRRSPKGKQFVKTYLKLIPDEKRIVHCLWVNWAQLPYRFANPSQFQEKGWTPFYENQRVQWNLLMTDKKLIDTFIREIRLLREIQKIPKPRRNEGEKHRGVSWKSVEVLDRKQNGIGKLTDSERHIASVAKRQAEEYFVEYERALDEWHNNQNPLFITEEADDKEQSE